MRYLTHHTYYYNVCFCCCCIFLILLQCPDCYNMSSLKIGAMTSLKLTPCLFLCSPYKDIWHRENCT